LRNPRMRQCSKSCANRNQGVFPELHKVQPR
jgi:hypothetical protein